MKNIKLILSVIMVACLMTSCEITNVNVDPDNPSGDKVNAGAIYPGMITQSHRNLVALGGRIAGLVNQQFEGLDAQQIAYAQYNIGEDDSDDLWDFGLYGGGAMVDCFVIMQNNEGEVSALAKLFMAANLGLATSVWGDVPYSDAFRAPENLTPTYDSQSDVYATIQSLLSESIADGVDIGIGSFGGTGSGSADWVKTAHALKARYYLHLTSVNGVSAAQSALSEAQMALSSIEDQHEFIYSTPAQNAHPFYLFDNDRPSTMGFGTTLYNMMTGDPRLPLYTTDGESFAGVDGLFWGQADSPSILISYWEVKFIEAEALLWTGGTDADILAALKEAITANMEYVGVTGTVDHDNDVNTPEISVITNYVDNVLSFSGTTQEKLETIITEKYKALYGNAPIESWNDYKRTGYPALTPNPNAVTNVNPSKVIPRRFLYPLSERQTNLENYEAAISAQGGHLLDDDTWAFPSN